MCRVAATELPYLDQILFNSDYYLNADLKRENELKEQLRKQQET
jgi:hypothetical protein